MGNKRIVVSVHTPVPKREIGEPNFFTAQGVSVSYGRYEALHDVSFSVAHSSLCGLMGPNGAGKSTLFKCCMNFMRPTSGTIEVQGKLVNTLSPGNLSRLISYVPQDQKQVFPFTVREMVSMGRNAQMKGILRLSAEDYEKVDYTLEQMGISELANRPYTRLSGGQRQLTLIARALVQEAPLMLLDEPTSALDFNNQITVWRALQHIANSGVTVMVCCHDPNHILWFCDTVLILKEGRVLAQTTPEQVSQKGLLSELYGEYLRCGMIDGRPVVYPYL